MVDKSIPIISNNEIKEIIHQFSELGGKVLFLCSEGEPLFYPDKFLEYCKLAQDARLRVITYTNATRINEELSKHLHKYDVNLVLKLESLHPEKNDYILGSKSKNHYKVYFGQRIPKSIINVLEEYQDDLEKIVLSSMFTKINSEDVLEIRRWSFEELDIMHFIKLLYNYGQAEKNSRELLFNTDELKNSTEKIYEYDLSQGFNYPRNLPDSYSFDIRRFLNNTTNDSGFPLRIFGHPRGGIFHNSGVINTKFGFPDGIIISMRDKENRINLEEYFTTIYKHITGEG